MKSKQIIQSQLEIIQASLNEIGSNAAFIQRELPGLDLRWEIEEKVGDVVGEFEWKLSDIGKEVHALEEKLGLHPEAELFWPESNLEAPVVIENLKEFFCKAVLEFDRLISHPDGKPKDDLEPAILVILLNESGANIMNAAIALTEALDAIKSLLEAETIPKEGERHVIS